MQINKTTSFISKILKWYFILKIARGQIFGIENTRPIHGFNQGTEG